MSTHAAWTLRDHGVHMQVSPALSDDHHKTEDCKSSRHTHVDRTPRDVETIAPPHEHAYSMTTGLWVRRTPLLTTLTKAPLTAAKLRGLTVKHACSHAVLKEQHGTYEADSNGIFTAPT